MSTDHTPEKARICHEFIDTGRCGHSDVEHDAMTDGRLDEFEYTLTRRALRQIKAEAWDQGYAARRSEDRLSPGESNPYRATPPGESGAAR